jgi:hypothetical protein
LSGEDDRAVRALHWLRGANDDDDSDDEDVANEIATIHANVRRQRDHSNAGVPVVRRQLVRPLFVTCGLMFFHR